MPKEERRFLDNVFLCRTAYHDYTGGNFEYECIQLRTFEYKVCMLNNELEATNKRADILQLSIWLRYMKGEKDRNKMFLGASQVSRRVTVNIAETGHGTHMNDKRKAL
jgi:hypothetical protein